jgi:hypothetical protein
MPAHGRIDDLQFIVQEPWRIASKQRSCTTREYLGVVTRGLVQSQNKINGVRHTPQRKIASFVFNLPNRIR